MQRILTAAERVAAWHSGADAEDISYHHRHDSPWSSYQTPRPYQIQEAPRWRQEQGHDEVQNYVFGEPGHRRQFHELDPTTLERISDQPEYFHRPKPQELDASGHEIHAAYTAQTAAPQILYRTMNLRHFNAPTTASGEYDYHRMADAIINHLQNYKHAPGVGQWWTPHREDVFTEGTMIYPDVRNYPVRLTAEWSGDPGHLDPNKGASGPTWEGWPDEKVIKPGTPLNLTGIHVYDEGDPLRPRRQPWRNVMRQPRQVAV